MNAKDAALIALTVTIWGVNFLFMRAALDEMPPMVLGLLRFLAVLFPAVFLLKRPPVSWPLLAVYGLGISFGQFGFMFAALSMGFPTGLAALLVQSQVFFTVLVATLFFREPVRANHLFGMAAAAFGLFLIGIGHYQGSLPLLPLLMVLCAGFSWAVGNIALKRIGRVNPLALVVWGGLPACAAFAAVSLHLYGAEGLSRHIGAIGIQGWGSVLFLAYISSLVGYTAWGSVLSRHPAGKVTPFALLVPVLALLLGRLILDEQLGAWHWLGIATVLGGLLLHVFGLPFKKRTGA